METRRFTAEEIGPAADIIRRGGLLGIPTETVYGLGANGLDPAAVRRIFEAKGRPQDNPLILHVPAMDWLERYCKHIPAAAYTLAERFWPGPLTMILERREMVPDVTTAGLDTVGMRCPDHPVTRAILAAADLPVAAPSGNTSGRPSPTSAADMLEDMDGKIDGIVDGGPCSVGVESTIVDLTVTPPRLLRPGGVTLEQLRAALGEVAVDPAVTRLMGAGEQPRAPGMKYRHYAPKAPVTVVKGEPSAGAIFIARHVREGEGMICFDEYAPLFEGLPVERLGPAADKAEQARRVFDALRRFDHTDVTGIWAQCPDDHGIGLAITNRLNKAAGFHIIDLDRDGPTASAPICGRTPDYRERDAFLDRAAGRVTPNARPLAEVMACLERDRGLTPYQPTAAERVRFRGQVLEWLNLAGRPADAPFPEMDLRCWRVPGQPEEGRLWQDMISGKGLGRGAACRGLMEELALLEGVTEEDIRTRSPRFLNYAYILKRRGAIC